ncbi:At2g23090 like protein [Pholiota molesta]|nr:At2g23090 like protein [Pholiota molesta]
MGNGAKAQQKRERNADKNPAAGSKSQARINEAAKSIVCATCKQPFLVTTRAPATAYRIILVDLYSLEEHSKNKHSKTMAECFPNFK